MIKISDIRPEAAMNDQPTAMQHDIDWLQSRRENFVDVLCPACGGSERIGLYEKYGLNHVSCSGCRTQYITPRPTSEILGEFYAQSENYRYWARYIFPASRTFRREHLFRPRALKIARAAQEYLDAEDRSLLEIGAAHGMFCEEVIATKAFSKVSGIEPTPDLAATCRSLGIDVIEAPYERVSLDERVDVIAHFEVIEHLYDPKAFLEWSADQLNNGGLVYLTCPNIEGFETIILGRNSGAVDHEHLNLFTPSSLTLLMNRCGFDVVEIETPGVLDVEIVQKAMAAGVCDPNTLNPIVLAMIDPSRADATQRFCMENKLSSNLSIIAKKR